MLARTDSQGSLSAAIRPTRGVDVGAKQSIYRMMRLFVREGDAILLYSTELDELVHLCDRCLYVSNMTARYGANSAQWMSARWRQG